MIDYLRLKIEELREIKKSKTLNFIQLGVGDSIKYDFVDKVMTRDDHGILVEPVIELYELAKNNKKNYENYIFYNFAVLPEKFKESKFYKQESDPPSLPLGSTFIGDLNKKEWKKTEVRTILLVDFLKCYVKNSIDCFFTDIEGLDHTLISELLNYISPDLILFESWWEQSVEKSNVKEKLIEKGYTVREESGDICATSF